MFETLFNSVRHETVSHHSEGLYPSLFTDAPQSQGCERPSVSAKFIKGIDKSGLSNQEMAWTVGTL